MYAGYDYTGDVWFQCKGSPLHILETGDPIDREVEFFPTKAPRWMLNGRQNPGNATDLFFIGCCGENFFVIIINGCIDLIIVLLKIICV